MSLPPASILLEKMCSLGRRCSPHSHQTSPITQSFFTSRFPLPTAFKTPLPPGISGQIGLLESHVASKPALHIMAPTRPRPLGLDDPNVRVCYDRGESDYNANHPATPATPQPPSHHLHCDHEDDLVANIKCELDESRVRHPPDSNYRFFVPRNELRTIITPDRVLQIIEHLAGSSPLSPLQRAELRDKICFGDKQCWKLLLILCMIGRQDQLLDLIDSEGASDQCLPIEIDSSGSNNRCRIQHHSHPTISSWPAPVREEASRWSYAVKAPYFTRNRGSHNHYILDDHDVLPILPIDTGASSTYVKTGYNDKVDDANSPNGGFGDVDVVVLDESHYHFDGLDVRSTNPHIPSMLLNCR